MFHYPPHYLLTYGDLKEINSQEKHLVFILVAHYINLLHVNELWMIVNKVNFLILQ